MVSSTFVFVFDRKGKKVDVDMPPNASAANQSRSSKKRVMRWKRPKRSMNFSCEPVPCLHNITALWSRYCAFWFDIDVVI